MKKLIFILSVILISTNTFSQSDIHTNYSYMGWWNSSKNDFEFGDKEFTNAKFTFKGDMIYSSDKEISYYKVLRSPTTDTTEKYKMIKSECKDEKGIFCSFNIKIYSDGEKYVIIMYENVCFIYHIDEI